MSCVIILIVLKTAESEIDPGWVARFTVGERDAQNKRKTAKRITVLGILP